MPAGLRAADWVAYHPNVSRMVKHSMQSDLAWEITRCAIREAMHITKPMRTQDRHRLILHRIHVHRGSRPSHLHAAAAAAGIPLTPGGALPGIRPANQWYGATAALRRRTEHLRKRCGHPTRSHAQIYSGAIGGAAALAWVASDTHLSLDEDEQEHWERILEQDRKLARGGRSSVAGIASAARRNSIHGRESALQTMPLLVGQRGGRLQASHHIEGLQTHIGYIRPEALQYRVAGLPEASKASEEAGTQDEEADPAETVLVRYLGAPPSSKQVEGLPNPASASGAQALRNLYRTFDTEEVDVTSKEPLCGSRLAVLSGSSRLWSLRFDSARCLATFMLRLPLFLEVCQAPDKLVLSDSGLLPTSDATIVRAASRDPAAAAGMLSIGPTLPRPPVLSTQQAARAVAAVLIQKAFRSHLSRTRLRPNAAQRVTDRRAVVAVQRCARARRGRRRTAMLRAAAALSREIDRCGVRTLYVDESTLRCLAMSKATGQMWGQPEPPEAAAWRAWQPFVLLEHQLQACFSASASEGDDASKSDGFSLANQPDCNGLLPPKHFAKV